jgi:hypothetical protein
MSIQKNFDLAELLPKQYRNRTITTLIRSLFNNHLSKDESVILYGFAGSEQQAAATDIYIREADLERQVNQLSPVLYSKQGTEERLVTWRELVQRLVTLGVPYDSIGDWLKVEALNFVPFIDLDKFCNFNEYVWVGKWVLEQPTLPWHDLGIPANEAVTALNAFNPDSAPDYYVIQRGALDSSHEPILPYLGLLSWSDWALGNMWVHKADAYAFQLAHQTLNTNKLVQAIRPILEFESTLKLSLHFQGGQPVDDGTLIGQPKTAPNQLPLFDLYYHDGSHSSYISAGFFYKESTDQPIDAALGRRIVRDASADLIFSHSFKAPTEDRPLFLKRYNGTEFVLASPWRGAHDLEQAFVKYETAGTIVNADKLQNYESYYWAGAADGALPAYNPTANAEYVVIEAGGASGWSLDNRWKHVSTLTSEQRLDYLQAQQPIIEFNKGLEIELVNSKTAMAQHPLFKLYDHDALTGTYTQLPDPANSRLTDAYTQAKLFVNIDDLSITKQAMLTSSEQATLLLALRGHQFAQTLLTGYYDNELDGTTFNYTTREFERLGAGNGQLSILSLDSDALPQVLQLSCHSDGVTFSVYSTVLGTLPNLTLNTPYSVGGATFTVVAGLTAFDETSIIKFEIKSSVFKKTNLYVKLDNVYRTVTTLDGYLRNASLDNRLVTIDTASAGAWKCPTAFFGNLDSIILESFRQGDLYSHFLSIIAAQPNLLGTASGQNSWRNLAHDYSIGGTIKIFNDRLPLLLGMLCQDAADPISLLDFSQEAYNAVLNRTSEFVEQELLEHIVAGDASFLSSSGLIDLQTYNMLRSYLERKSTVVDASTTLVDDRVNTPFANSSLTLKALTLTAPYLGLAPKIAPTIAYDAEQNMTVLVHHDGHSSSLPQIGFSTFKRLVTKRYKRSNGQETAGFIGGPVPPALPFKRQLWLDLSGEKLYVFDVVSDLGELPADASHGQFSYDRLTGRTWQYNGAWIDLGTTQSAQEAPWRYLDLSSTLTGLLLRLETELYDGCPSLPPALNVTALQANARWPVLMQREFEAFAAKLGIDDPYECAYDASNPFTWSYAGSGLGLTNPAVWQEVYRQVYGTVRPDLYPYIPCGFSTEGAFITAMIGLGALPIGTITWSTAFWAQPLTVAAIRAFLSSQGRPTHTSIDLATGRLLPPYSSGAAESLLVSPPPTPTQRFQYGDLGPIERTWTRTLEHITSTMQTYFRLDPLTFIDACWGDERLRIDEYDIIRPLGRKAHIEDVLLHGEPINRTTIATDALSLTCTLAPLVDTTFTIEVISATYGLLRIIEGSNHPVFCLASAITLGDYASGSLIIPRDGLNVSDKLQVVISSLGDLTTTIIESALGLEGMSQLYTHFHSYRAFELSYSADKSKLISWTPKLAYRFNTLIDTDALRVKANDAVVDTSGYDVYLKETELQSASWLTGLKISLLRKGSTQIVNGKAVPAVATVGQRGDDWLYRVDLTNAHHPALEWYEYDNNEFNTFFALSGKTSSDEWKRYTQKTTLRSLRGPFIVKGLQALVTFIFGYADRAAELGFIFNDPNDPVTDPTTGRLVGWQLLIEEFIDEQFNNPSDGGVFELTPFENRLWFKTQYGHVSDLSKTGSTRLVPGLYTTGSVRAPKGSFRVFRDGASMSVTSDVALTGALITTSVFEHVLVLDNQVGDITIADAFLGQHVDRIFLEGFKQAVPTGRPIYGGKYLVGNKMRTNMEGSVQQLSSLYDIAALKSDSLFDRASSLISFDRKDYHAELGTTLPTQLQFWRGMLKSKGTNRAISSFVNSSLYRSALIDEMWAYKLSEYGDIRRAVKVELNIRSDDMLGERANYLFLESDELAYIKAYLENGRYDMFPYDELAYDIFTLYTNEQLVNMDIVDPRGVIIVKPDDEARWNSFTDLGSISYMKAVILAEMVLAPTSLSTFYTIKDSYGKDVLADCFELVDIDALSENVYDVPVVDITSYVRSGSKVYRERGDYITGTTDPAEYSPPKFKRINSSQLQILDPTLLGKRLKVIAYGPPTKQFTPSELYRDEGGHDTPINRNIIWWDPARGSHSPDAHATVDYQTIQDPARYNVTYLKHKAKPSDSMRVWGSEQVGKVWWDTSTAGWMRYYDGKLYPDYNERLAQWGSLADWASIDLYEWVESDKDPSQWAGTGEPGIQNNLTRSRTWYQRPVIWLYSANPQLAAKVPLKKQTVTLELLNGNMLLSADGQLPKFAVNERITHALYFDATRTSLLGAVGVVEVTSDVVKLVAGSLASKTVPAYASTPSFTNFELVVLDSALETPPYGQLVLDYEIENGIVYIRATFPATNQTQRTIFTDSPVKANTPFEILFAELGFKLTAKNVYGQTDSWGGLGVLTQAQRAERTGIELGSSAHDIMFRQAVSTRTLLDPITTIFEGSATVGTIYGWVSWLEPSDVLTADDLDSNFGSWSSFTGAWVAVGTALNDKKQEILAELSSPQPIRQYEERWTSWRIVTAQVKESTYYTTTTRDHFQALSELSFDVPIEDMARAACYINGRRVVHNTRIVPSTTGFYIYVPETEISIGSKLRVELAARKPTAAELKLKLEGMSTDPTKLVEYKLDTPYVKQEERNEFGRVMKTRYFFWVKNKETPGANKKLSIKLATQQLKQHSGPYAVPLILKRFNQLDGRPNRYAMLTVVDLSRFVRKDNQYKLRITENGSMRDDDENITLRTTHAEWKLIRKNQPTRISKDLWDKLVDTLCGETATGQSLPFASYAEYDSRNGTTSRIGLKQGQVLSDATQAIATVKGTLLDTQVVTYDVVLGSFVPAPLEFAGYDASALDTYLASSTSIRVFMAAIWTYGAPRNINELFFAVLEDALVATSELADIMKTSFVTLDEVRTVVIEG